MELGFNAMLDSSYRFPNPGNKNSDVDHIKCSRGL